MVEVTKSALLVITPGPAQIVGLIETVANAGYAIVLVGKVALDHLQALYHKNNSERLADIEIKMTQDLKNLSQCLNHLAVALFTIVPLGGIYRWRKDSNDAVIQQIFAIVKLNNLSKMERMQYYYVAAKKGSSEACYQLADMMKDPSSPVYGLNQAFGLATHAANQGNDKAQFLLGHYFYVNGNGIPQDLKAAAKWIKQAALQGNAEAQAALASMYFLGNFGLSKDDKLAVYWNRKAMAQGNVNAKAGYAYCLLEGLGGLKKNEKKAILLLKKAACEGCGLAQYLIGTYFKEGKYGFVQSIENANRMFREAVKNGYAPAKDEIVVQPQPIEGFSFYDFLFRRGQAA